jgi:hypothetical protein
MKIKTKYMYALAFMGLFALVINGVAYIITRPANVDETDLYSESYKNIMKRSDAESVMAVIQAETFDGAFSHYSTYKDISDTKFHELRKAYTSVRQELFDYVNEAANKSVEKPYYMATY